MYILSSLFIDMNSATRPISGGIPSEYRYSTNRFCSFVLRLSNTVLYLFKGTESLTSTPATSRASFVCETV